MKSAGILGAGSFLPPKVITNQFFKEATGISPRVIEKLIWRTKREKPLWNMQMSTLLRLIS